MVQYVIDSEGTVTVEGAAITVEKSGFEGVLSRAKAPQYHTYDEAGNLLFSIKRHMFSNNPFYVVDAAGESGSIKVSEGMSEMRMAYRIGGCGYGYQGDFVSGTIELTRDGVLVAHLEARSTGKQTHVNVDAAGECAPATLGIALAYGSMIGYLLGMRQ